MNTIKQIQHALWVSVAVLLLSGCVGVSEEPTNTPLPIPTTTTTLLPTAVLTQIPVESPTVVSTVTPRAVSTTSPEPTAEEIDALSPCDVSRDLAFEKIRVVGNIEKVDDSNSIWIADLGSNGCNLLIAVDFDLYNEWKGEVPEAFIRGSRVIFEGTIKVYININGRIFDSHPPTPLPLGGYLILGVDSLPEVIEETP